MRQGVRYLSHDPLPRRVLNHTLPGHSLCTLYEADAWIMAQLQACGYLCEQDDTLVQAFGRDYAKPLAHQYAAPPPGAPWYTAHNVIAKKQGSEVPDELIIVLAHKDSQSWIASPGANDNAIGTVGVLEVARALAAYQPRHSLWFLWCNEEHTPWTSVTAAVNIKTAGLDVLAAINVDGIGVKAPRDAGKMTNVTRFVTPEGERLADLMADLNAEFHLGLAQSKHRSERPGDDDGSFINAGFPWAVCNTGSIPYGDPNYHTEGDTYDKVDYANAVVAARLTLAAVLRLDAAGRP